jgi:hypothetical protein
MPKRKSVRRGRKASMEDVCWRYFVAVSSDGRTYPDYWGRTMRECKEEIPPLHNPPLKPLRVEAVKFLPKKATRKGRK